MPNIGIFNLKISLGILGNFFPITVEGPPDKIIPLTFSNIFFFFKIF